MDRVQHAQQSLKEPRHRTEKQGEVKRKLFQANHACSCYPSTAIRLSCPLRFRREGRIYAKTWPLRPPWERMEAD